MNNKTLLLREMVATACASQALAGMETTVEKELLHYDIMTALSQSGLLAKLTFQGGTCLRMAYGSDRLSEDLDFAGGIDFSPEDYKDLARYLSIISRHAMAWIFVLKHLRHGFFSQTKLRWDVGWCQLKHNLKPSIYRIKKLNWKSLMCLLIPLCLKY